MAAPAPNGPRDAGAVRYLLWVHFQHIDLGPQPHNAALVAGLWAMKPNHADTRAFVVGSPLQDSACRYGSSFSRAVEIARGDLRHLTISGTASIDRSGATVHVGDVAAQLDLTMRVVEAILHSRGMVWAHVMRALAYFRRPSDVAAYRRWEAVNGTGPLPVIIGAHTVCRANLLYEVEVDALTCR